LQAGCHETPAFFVGRTTSDLDVGEPGIIRRRRKPDHAGSNPAIQTDRNVPVAERPRRRSSKPDRRVRLPPGTLNDGSLTTRRTTGPVGNRQTTLAQNEGCWGFDSPLGHSKHALADQRSGRRPLKVKIVGSNPIQGTATNVSAGHRRAQVAVTHPHSLCRFNSCPTHCNRPCSSTGRARLS
jgi:hypothetical protein